MKPTHDKKCFSYKLAVWVGMMLAVIVICSSGILVKISQGAEFSKGDIIFIVVVIGACVLAIIVTVSCHLACRRRNSNSTECGAFNALCCCTDDSTSKKMKDISKEFGSDCAICLEEKNPLKKPVVEISCNHTYHKACISKCLEIDRHAKCPKCRRPTNSYTSWQRLTASIQAIVNKRNMRRTILYTAQPTNENMQDIATVNTSCQSTEHSTEPLNVVIHMEQSVV